MKEKIILMLLITYVFAQYNWQEDGAPISQGFMLNGSVRVIPMLTAV